MMASVHCPYCAHLRSIYHQCVYRHSRPEVETPYVPPHFKEGFLQVDLRPKHLPRTRRDFAALMKELRRGKD